MAQENIIIADTNILFSALLREQSTFTDLLLRSDYQIYVCEFVMVELFKHKDKLVAASRLSEDEILRLLYVLLRRLNVYKEDLIRVENRKRAFDLCREIDESDTPHVALTLELGGLLWTGDKKLKTALAQKGFSHFFDPNVVE